MNAFRGTLIMAVIVVVLGLCIWLIAPEVLTVDGEDVPVLVEGKILVEFEEHELVAVRIERPEDEILLEENDNGTWSIVGTDFVASRSMVNRIKHQLHALTARALVTEACSPAAAEWARYARARLGRHPPIP